jgi:hypothetical protein
VLPPPVALLDPVAICLIAKSKLDDVSVSLSSLLVYGNIPPRILLNSLLILLSLPKGNIFLFLISVFGAYIIFFLEGRLLDRFLLSLEPEEFLLFGNGISTTPSILCFCISYNNRLSWLS